MAKRKIPTLTLSNPFRKRINYLKKDGTPQTVIRTGGGAGGGVSANERTLSLLKKFWVYYQGEGTVFASINSTTWNTVMTGFNLVSDEPNAKLLIATLCDHLNIQKIFRDAVTHTLIFGDAFVEKIGNRKKEISRLKVVDPRTMIINTDEYGDIIDFQQEIGGSKLPPIKPENIIHLKFFPIPGTQYGLSLITPNLDTIDRKVSTDEALFNAIKRHGTKKTIVYVGSEKDGQVPPPEVMDDIKEVLEDISEKNEFVVPWYIKFDSMDERGIEGVEEYFNYFQTQLVVGLLCPEEALGMGKGSTEATARIKAVMYERMIRAFQNDLAITLREELFNPHLEGNGFEPNTVKIKFNNVTEEDEALRAKWVGNLLTGNNPPFTNNEIRAMFGYDPLEDMEEMPKKPEEKPEEKPKDDDEEDVKPSDEPKEEPKPTGGENENEPPT